MTRRLFLSMVAAAGVPSGPVVIPVHLVLDGKAKPWCSQNENFWSRIWPEAVRDFARCGIILEQTQTTGEVGKPSGRQPVITGLERGVLNLVVTDQVPMIWDHGLALGGVTTRYRGHHMCMVSVNWAHGHQLPLLSVNTVVHELLHALLHDIFENRPRGMMGHAREFRVDAYATRMWLFSDGAAVRETARAYRKRLVGEFLG
jgi:hypothetical protein